MSSEMQACCGLESEKPYVSSITYTHTVVKTTISFSDIHEQMISDTPEMEKRKQGAHEHSIHQQIMASLPDIKDLLKPWYFRRASEHNFDVIRKASLEFVNQTDARLSYEVAFKRIGYVNGLWEGKAECQCHSLAKSNEPDKPVLENLLTDDDKTKLESLHRQACASGKDTDIVESLAKHVAGERIFARANQQPILDRELLESFFAKGTGFKNTFVSRDVIEGMKGLLS